MSAIRTDNSDPRAKLDLRRYFLRKYHADRPPDVLDCCQGQGLLWKQLRREFSLGSYWGIDLKPKKGRLKIDSVRVLGQSGWTQNVIDIDTYGSPWKHWKALLPNVARPTTVFMTIGQHYLGTDGLILDALGLAGLNVPPAIAAKLGRLGLNALLTEGCDSDIRLVEAIEAPSESSVRYIGARIEAVVGSRTQGTTLKTG